MPRVFTSLCLSISQRLGWLLINSILTASTPKKPQKYKKCPKNI
jgi:hypothetical protein